MLFTHANRARAAKTMLIGLLASLPWLSSMAQAQGNATAWPNKPIRLINPLGTGGTAEVLARHAAKMLSDGLGQPIIVETKAGAAGTIGADYVAKSAADGYTLLYGVTGANVIAPAIYRKLPYDPVKDLAPISMLFSGTNYLLVHPSLGVKSLAEFIALAKAKPGSITFASAGNGSMSHLNAETLKTITGIDLVHVPYKGGGAGRDHAQARLQRARRSDLQRAGLSRHDHRGVGRTVCTRRHTASHPGSRCGRSGQGDEQQRLPRGPGPAQQRACRHDPG
jgi:tripartite-type tricarboxylate transporter receptor subunit TctC